MKHRLFLLLGMIAFVVGSSYLYHECSIREDVLYLETVLREVEDETEQVQPEFISRAKAINIAYTTFSEGLGIQLLKENVITYINLYTDTEEYETYKWFMSWYNEMTGDYYSCTINASDGKILSLYSDEMSAEIYELKPDQKEQTVNQEEFMAVVVPFLQAIDISMSHYYVVQGSGMDHNEVVDDFTRCIFVNRADKTDQFILEMNEQTKSIRSYERRRVESEEG